MVDRMMTSSDKPIPHGQTEAEFTAQQQQAAMKAAVTREDVTQRTESTVKVAESAEKILHKPVVRPTVQIHSELQQLDIIREVKKHIQAIAALCLHMQSGTELSDFYMHLARCEEAVDSLTVVIVTGQKE